ncbi:MAG TPA: hypothetical protein VFG15_13155 [Amycolatopsis sp.]|nr:hypothetical protein [Amycolatopsis sp.]
MTGPAEILALDARDPGTIRECAAADEVPKSARLLETSASATRTIPPSRRWARFRTGYETA